MAKHRNPRKARFRAALALAGLTAEQWADQQGITAGHLSMVLTGKRESRALMEKIEQFTEQHISAAA